MTIRFFEGLVLCCVLGACAEEDLQAFLDQNVPELKVPPRSQPVNNHRPPSADKPPITIYDVPRVLETPDHKKFNLSTSPQGATTGNTPDGRLEGYNLKYAFYGVWIADGKNYGVTEFAGIGTQTMPSSGTATYIGRAERWDSINDEAYGNAATTLHVNFAEKSLYGTIEFPGMRRNIVLEEGRIKGNEFSGSAHVLGDHRGQYEGSFYGPKADEMAGLVKFSDNQDLDTAFGGRKYQ